MRVALHENPQVVWASMSGKLYRSAPENIRPITALESQMHKDVLTQNEAIPEISRPPSVEQSSPDPMPQPEIPPSSTTPNLNGNDLPETVPAAPSSVPPESASSEQPDFEPETEGPSGVDVPVPDDISDDLNCVGLICVDETEVNWEPALTAEQAYQFEILITEEDISRWREEEHPCEMAFLASTSKKQRSEVKIQDLTPSQRAEFDVAKTSEIQNWLNTKTVTKLCRSQISPQDIMRCLEIGNH